MDHAQVVLIARACLAAALGFLIGWERHIHGSPAGDRTYALVAVGAAAFTTVGVTNFPATTEKLIAGIVTGVGFLGAGVIFRDRGSVYGLTSAAGLWGTAAVGVVVGVGEAVAGIVLTGLVLLLLIWDRVPLIQLIGPRDEVIGHQTEDGGAAATPPNATA